MAERKATMQAQAQPEPYIDLIREFVDRRIDADEFETRYLALFKQETGRFADHDLFETLDELFADVDEYVSDPALRDSPEDLDE